MFAKPKCLVQVSSSGSSWENYHSSFMIISYMVRYLLRKLIWPGFFGPGQLENLKAMIHGIEQPDETGTAQSSNKTSTKRSVFVSAVFISTYRLTSKQRSIMVTVKVIAMKAVEQKIFFANPLASKLKNVI